VDKRSKEELLEYVASSEDIGFMYKVVSNNAILKFPLTIGENFNVEKDDVKFAFNIVLMQKKSKGQSIEMVLPVMFNTGKMKINNSGGNVISSAQSSASMASTRQAAQETKIA